MLLPISLALPALLCCLLGLSAALSSASAAVEKVENNVEIPYVMERHEIADGHLTGAMCNDGTKFAYYFEAAHEPSAAHQWVFYLGGGDLCWDFISCMYRKEKSPSKMTAPTKAWKVGEGIVSPFQLENEYLYGANHVYMPYCSSDLWSGTGQNGIWQFRGRDIIREALKDIDVKFGLNRAGNRVLFSGGSAGGLGVVANIDFVREQLSSADVYGLPDAGWFMNLTAYRTDPFPPVMEMAKEGYRYWRAQLFPGCTKHFPGMPWGCYDAYRSNMFIQSKMFYQTGQYDHGVLKHLGVRYPWTKEDLPYVQNYGKVVRAALHNSTAVAKASIFSPSCCEHSIDLVSKAQTALKINGTDFQQAVKRFFIDDERVFLVDAACADGKVDCGDGCYVDVCKTGPE